MTTNVAEQKKHENQVTLLIQSGKNNTVHSTEVWATGHKQLFATTYQYWLVQINEDKKLTMAPYDTVLIFF